MQVPTSRLAWPAVIFAAVLLAVLVAVYTYPMVLFWADALPYNSGDTAMTTWELMWLWHALLSDPANLTNPSIYFPVTGGLFFHHLVLPLALPFGAVLSLTDNPILAGNAVILLGIWLNGLAAGLLAYRWTRDWVATAGAAVTFAFSPILLQRLHHPPLLMMWWIPLALLCLDSYLRRPRALAAIGVVACIGLQFLTAVYLNFYIVFACAVFALVWCADGWRATHPKQRRAWLANHGWQIVGHGVAAAVISAALIGPATVGYLRANEAWSVDRSLTQVVEMAATPASYLSPDERSLVYGQRSLGQLTDQGAFAHERHLFPGLLPPVLALGAVLCFRSRASEPDRQRITGLLAIGATAVVLSFGPYLTLFGRDTGIPLPYLALYDWLPGFRSMRAPARFMFMALPALAILTAYGIVLVRRWQPKRRWLGWGIVVLLLAESARLPVTPSYLYDVYSAQEQAAVAATEGPILWLPVDWPARESPYLETARMVQNRALVPMLNGYYGFIPPTFRDLQRLERDSEPATVLAVAQQLGARTLILDRQRIDPAVLPGWEQVVRGPAVEHWTSVGRLLIARLTDGSLRTTELVASLSGGVVPAARAGEANLGLDLYNPASTPWANRQPRGPQRVSAAWRISPSGEVVETAGRVRIPFYLLPHERTTVPLVLETPAAPGSYHLTLRSETGEPLAHDLVEVRALGAQREVRGPADFTGAFEQVRVQSPPAGVRPRSRIRVTGRIRNTGPSIWTGATPDEVPGQVLLAYRWHQRDAATGEFRQYPEEGRLPLARDILPGETAEFAITVIAPPESGDYQLVVTAAVDGLALLSRGRAADAHEAVFDLTVLPQPAGG